MRMRMIIIFALRLSFILLVRRECLLYAVLCCAFLSNYIYLRYKTHIKLQFCF